jgi:hypothetical protein
MHEFHDDKARVSIALMRLSLSELLAGYNSLLCRVNSGVRCDGSTVFELLPHPFCFRRRKTRTVKNLGSWKSYVNEGASCDSNNNSR